MTSRLPKEVYALIETRAGLLEELQVFAAKGKRDEAFFDSVRNSQPEFEGMSDEQLEKAYENFDAGDEAEWHREDPEIIC